MYRFPKTSALICSAIFCCSLMGEVVYSQDEVELDQQALEAIGQIESMGGHVLRIAANTNQYEASFHLASVPVNDESLAPLRFIPNLVWLNLANSKITDDGLRQIADFPLTKLHLEKTEIGNDGLQHLERLEDLEYLNIYATNVGDDGLEHLKELKKLKKLYVWQSSVTDSGIKDLQAALPELEIVSGLSFKAVETPTDGADESKPESKKD